MMDQVEAQLKKLRTKLGDVPAFQKAEVSWPRLDKLMSSLGFGSAANEKWPKIPFVAAAEKGPLGLGHGRIMDLQSTALTNRPPPHSRPQWRSPPECVDGAARCPGGGWSMEFSSGPFGVPTLG
jgi:hypothetical protein